MGNIGSQAGHQVSQRENHQERQWAHSFPRTQHSKLQQPIKVLPDIDSRQKLKVTNNGEILQSGGTLTGRQTTRNVNVDNSKHEYKENVFKHKPRLSNQRYSFHKLGYKSNHHFQEKHNVNGILKEQKKLFGSEPDLRDSSNNHEMAEIRSKKKYKAPPPPNSRISEKSEGEENSSENEIPLRKARLFKTRMETKKLSSHHQIEHTNKSIKNEPNLTDLRVDSQGHQNIRKKRLSLPENLDFQQELKQATKKFRNPASTEIKTEYELMKCKRSSADGIEKEKLETLDPTRENLLKQKIKEIMGVEENNNLNIIDTNIREEPSGKESSTSELSTNAIFKDECLINNEKPETFYFGMQNPINKKLNNFVAKFHNSSDSDISSDMELIYDTTTTNNGINLQLRPILPKKPLEVPRFSPAAAWKLLSSMDNDPSPGTIASEDLPLLFEERIEKYPRPPPPNINIEPGSNNDKSGDSGISGDARPTGYEEMAVNARHVQELSFGVKECMSWTPQQDLEDCSSLEELNLETSVPKTHYLFPNANQPHVFSLSLPRDNHLASYITDKTQYTGLQRLKRSVSGVLSNLSSNKKDLTQSHSNQDESSNWFFSKSAPNSLNNGFNSLEIKSTHQTTSLRIIYLPEGATNNATSCKEHDLNKHKLSFYSKSCEDLSAEVKKRVPETLQDPPKINNLELPWKVNKKPKKFTFQSTVRQIERRRMAERLSKEAEKKEKQRLRELEAMQKVEEEFQRKRAREKASIRHQLRLYCMDNSNCWCSLPPNLENNEERPEPDGAFCSSSSSPLLPKNHAVFKNNAKSQFNRNKINHLQATQELSEYRQSRIDYKEYRGNAKYLSNGKWAKHTTIHPQTTFNMPKARSSTINNENYKKEKAFSIKMLKPASIHSEDSQNISTIYHNKYAPLTRF